MDHLTPAVPELELAGNPTRRADRQARAHPRRIGEKEHELDVARFILDQHLEGRARASVRRFMMLGDRRLDRDDRIGNSVADLRPCAPVEGREGQMEQDVHDPRALGLSEQPVEQLRVLRSDAGQRAGRREQRVEERRAHGGL